jgi:hypothetical protein
MSQQWCYTCHLLRSCKDATVQMVVLGGGCGLWEEAKAPILSARSRVVRDFGAASILANPNPQRVNGEEVMGDEAKSISLRNLCLAMGLLPKKPQSFNVQSPRLIELLTEHYPDIAEMSTDEVEALVAEVKAENGETPPQEKKAPAEAEKPRGGRKPVGRPPKAKAEEPEEEEPVEEEEPEEEAPAKPGRRPAGKAPAKPAAPAEPEAAARKPGPRPGPKPGQRAPTAAAPAETKVAGDNGKLEATVNALGAAIMELKDMIKGLGDALGQMEAEIETLTDSMTAIDAHLAFKYNGEFEPEELITSLSEVDWTGDGE